MTNEEEQDLKQKLKLQEKDTMTGTTITDSGASITISIIGQQPRNIIKSHILEITVVKTNIIKIDIGQGALGNLFIPYTDVNAPSAANPVALKDAINAMLSPASTNVSMAGMATEARQIDTNNLISTLSAISDSIKSLIISIDDKLYYQPVMIDSSEPGIVYEGYAALRTGVEEPRWAIRRVTQQGDVEVRLWADGDRNFIHSWLNRANLMYM